MPFPLLLAFIVVPLAELYVITQVAHILGLPLTLGVLLLVSVAGAALVKREGWRSWRALQDSLRTGRQPTRALSDAALVLVGGVLLLTPGFLTDAVGLLLVLPPTRAMARRGLTALLVRRALGRAGSSRRSRAAGHRNSHGGSQRPAAGLIIEGEVLPEDGSAKPRPR